MRKPTVLVLLVLIVAFGLLQSCRTQEARMEASSPKQEAVLIGQENLIEVKTDEILSGPVVSGTLRASREATVRAEVGGSILQIHGEVGQAVRRGALLARIDDGSLRDLVTSAQSALRSAQNAMQVAEREESRTARLVQAGALAERDLEVARNAVSAAQAQLADAEARLVSAKQQLAKTTVFAPISGVVAARPANAGDIVTPGDELFRIIDPSRLELEATVPSDELPNLRVGTPVDFEIRGSGRQQFTGRIERISPAADPITRQVSVFVALPNTDRRLVAGLFAEGRIATQRRETLVVPSDAVEREEATPWVTRVRDGKTERVEVQIGVEDRRTERLEILSGLTEGDILLVGAAQQMTPGTPVKITTREQEGD